MIFYIILYSLCIPAVFSSLGSHQNAPNTFIYQRIAFIFAGSARSFITPFVQRSIQYNLIQSLCPTHALCAYDIYVRTSSNDNNHYGMNSKGNLTFGSEKLRHDILRSLQTINPLKHSEHGKLHLTWIEIGSVEENQEMIDYGNNQKHALKHKVYRILDPRRYSMFYHRWKAYEMMLLKEREMERNYTWVVFARLDTAWGGPIDPIHLFSPTKIYAPDIWYSDLPDTFALLPRKVSDIYFSMESLMGPQILCLGGPNLDPATLKPKYLSSIGFNQSEIDFVQKEDCFYLFPNAYNITDPTGIVMSEDGISELILKRKLNAYGYEIQKETIRLVAVYMFILRLPLEPSCFYLNPDRLIHWAKVTNTVNCAFISTCHNINYDIKHYMPWNGYVSDCNHTGEHYTSDDPYESRILVAMKDSCLLHPQTTDLNFMPFRLRSRYQCLTSSRYSPIINMTACINYMRVGSFMEMYDQNQLFHFYPLLPSYQKISQYTLYPNEKKLCLTAQLPSILRFQESKKFNSSGHIDIKVFNEVLSNINIPLEMEDCFLTDYHPKPSIQMFVVILSDNPRFSKVNLQTELFRPSLYLKPLSQISIQWHWNHPITKTLLKFCLTYNHYNETSNRMILRLCMNNVLLLNSNSNSNTIANHHQILNNMNNMKSKGGMLPNNLQVFTLERSETMGPPLRPGITVGKYPTWSDP